MQAARAIKHLQIYSSFGRREKNTCVVNRSYRIFLTRDRDPGSILKGKEGQTWQFVSSSKLPKMRTEPLGKGGFLEFATLKLKIHPEWAILNPGKSSEKLIGSSLWPHAMLPILSNLEEVTFKMLERIALPKPGPEKFELIPIADLRMRLESLIAKKGAS